MGFACKKLQATSNSDLLASTPWSANAGSARTSRLYRKELDVLS